MTIYSMTIEEIADAIGNATGLEFISNGNPNYLTYTTWIKDGYGIRLTTSNSKTKKFGYKPQQTIYCTILETKFNNPKDMQIRIANNIKEAIKTIKRCNKIITTATDIKAALYTDFNNSVTTERR